uniref:Protein kinase domain-containing protein n=1 Tax=Angiostrongylus cantonensis TaxID=6313 RepID=A0A0K0DPN0_ANGCA
MFYVCCFLLETSSISRGSTASVPPVHIEIPENDKVNAEEAQVTNNSVLHQASSCEGTQRKHVNKRKDRKNINNPPKGTTNLWRPKSSREADNDVSSKSTGTLEEQQHEVVTGFLASCLREKRSEQQLKQRTRELDPTPSGSKSNCEVPKSSTVFNNSASFQGSTMRRWRRRTHLANHFETIKEFHSKYEHFRKLKLMQHRGFHLSSNRGIRVIAEKCVEDCENNIASTSDILGFKPVKPISVAEKGQLISFVENVIRERLRKEGLNACNNFEKRNRVDVECRLPVVSCKRRCLRAAPTSTTSKKEGAVSSENADLTYIEQLLDEMVSFITRDQSFNPLAECAQRIFDRNATSRTMNLQSEPVMMGKTKVSTLSRAHMQTDTFTTILKNLKYSKNESRELSDNVFTIGPAYYRRREVAVRLQHMNRQLSEQIRLEERILETFERFYEVYNPKGFFKMKLDMERDIDDGDSPETVYQKRMQRLRLVLNLPPGKLPADRKPDFGEQCASVISCPDENEMNRHMLGISPFWKGPLTKNNSKCFYLTRTGRRMHDKDESYTPLEDDYKEFYLEDLVDYRDPAVFRKDYSNMERIWTQLQNLNALLELLHNIGQNGDGEDEEDEQDESVDDEEDFNRQLEQAIQESCQEVQSTSKA